jgi:hypothetical protein
MILLVRFSLGLTSKIILLSQAFPNLRLAFRRYRKTAAEQPPMSKIWVADGNTRRLVLLAADQDLGYSDAQLQTISSFCRRIARLVMACIAHISQTNLETEESNFMGLAHRVCSTKAALLVLLLNLFALAAPLHGQTVLYNDGPDADIGYYQVNFGASACDSFVLSRDGVVTSFHLALYDVDDRNAPQQLRWTITTAPYGGSVLATGIAPLVRLQPPYLTKFLFFAWDMSFQVPPLNLPAGTYWIQIQDVTTQWMTYAYWAESGGPSAAYYSDSGSGSTGDVDPAISETFTVQGVWANAAAGGQLK